ncbi:MAG: glycosyltransferase [Bacteroidota bacterium]|nr:glycosyltransferase [Bacteroidota bacterium]
MKILIFSAFDPIPSDEVPPLRYANLAKKFLSEGDEVLYVTSSFFHLKGIQRHGKTWLNTHDPKNLKTIILPAPSYPKGALLSRLLSYGRLAFSLKMWLKTLKKNDFPDLILIASPPLLSGYYLSLWAVKNDIPYVLDIQDLWPEEWLRILPGAAGRFLLLLWQRIDRHTVVNATGVTSTSADFLKKRGKALVNKPSKVFWIGADTSGFAVPLPPNPIISIVCLGSVLNEEHLINACEALNNRNNIRLIIAGIGEKTVEIVALVKKMGWQNISIISWWNKDDIRENLSKADLGLVLAAPRSFMAFPNRAFSYLAAGVPVLSNIKGGELESLIKNHNLGMTINEAEPASILNGIDQCIGKFEFDDRKRIQAFAKKELDANTIYQSYYKWLKEIFAANRKK